MNIIKKQYRCKTAIPQRIYSDVQSGSKITDIYTYMYIYNKTVVLVYDTYSKGTDEYLVKSDNNTNKFEPVDRELKTKNLDRSIESGNDPTVKEYQINNNIITMTETYNEDQTVIRFKGEILLDGDAIRGVFYNEGKEVTPMRVYYNVDKPLPDPLLPDNDDNKNV